ncbi:MAG: hypothetical protein FD153_140 [Rhodospirillaceae bacterium]|nr:MAG: hypothetical protein FD153_140 [Rhodospirillaceae bacterium]
MRVALGEALCLAIVLLAGVGISTWASETPQRFVTRDLLAHLADSHGRDWNRIASLTFPLAIWLRREGDASVIDTLIAVTAVPWCRPGESRLACHALTLSMSR